MVQILAVPVSHARYPYRLRASTSAGLLGVPDILLADWRHWPLGRGNAAHSADPGEHAIALLQGVSTFSAGQLADWRQHEDVLVLYLADIDPGSVQGLRHVSGRVRLAPGRAVHDVRGQRAGFQGPCEPRAVAT